MMMGKVLGLVGSEKSVEYLEKKQALGSVQAIGKWGDGRDSNSGSDLGKA
ncbi:MAG: hypothetical protein P8X46_10810 [Nitrospirales bacterium]